MTLMPGAVWRPVLNHSGAMNAHLGPVMHSQEGYNSPFEWFNNPSSQDSSTLWFAKDGSIEQYVDYDLMAWTQAAGNGTFNGWEFEGYTTEPLTDAQILSAARAYVFGHRTYGWPLKLAETPVDIGFGWHGMGGIAWGGHLDCPGEIRKAQRGAILSSASQIITPPHPLPPESHDMDDNTFVRWCYMSILLRPVDAIGFSTNMAWLTAGGARSQVYTNLCDSAEGQHVTAQRRKSLGL
jgi:hypothetical protein